MNIVIEHIFISPDHNFVGHYGGPSGNHPSVSMPSVSLLAGRGIEGDRYALRETGHPKQITFFDMDVIDALSKSVQRSVSPACVRRNVFVRGLDLPALVNRTFRIGTVRFRGADDCKPCFWMDQAVAPGTEAFLKGKGGLRARILNSGELRVGETTFSLEPDT